MTNNDYAFKSPSVKSPHQKYPTKISPAAPMSHGSEGGGEGGRRGRTRLVIKWPDFPKVSKLLDG